MASGVGRTDRTPYVIYALAALQAAIGTYIGTRSDTMNAVKDLDRRITIIEAEAPIRREMRNKQISDMSERVRRLEERAR